MEKKINILLLKLILRSNSRSSWLIYKLRRYNNSYLCEVEKQTSKHNVLFLCDWISYWGSGGTGNSFFFYFCFLLTILLASVDLRILLNFRFCDNPLHDSMHFVSLRKSFHTCCKGMRSFYLPSPILLLLYFSLTITMIYLMLYSY